MGEFQRTSVAPDQRAVRRGEIVDIAAALFASKGYDATGIREIGESARLARGALYYYIGSKESLLEEIHNRVMDPLLAEAGDIAALEASAAARLRLVSEVLLQQIIHHHDHVWVFLHEYRSLTGDRRETFRRKRVEFQNIVLNLFAAGVADGEFVIEDLETAMLAFVGMHNYTYQWVRRKPGVDAETLSRRYSDIFFDGIRRR